MNRLTFTFILFFCTSLLFAQGTLRIKFEHKVAGQNLVLDQTQFVNWNGKSMNITRAQFYLSGITLSNGTQSHTATDTYFLVDASNPNQVFEINNQPLAQINKLDFSVGVDAQRNHLDPASYPASHPLAPKDPSMHWGWTAGYFFLVMEGTVDQDNNGSRETIYQFHNLDDRLYTPVSLPCNVETRNNAMELTITLDYAKLFRDMTLDGNVIKHGSSALNAQMMENAGGAGFFNTDVTTPIKNIAAESAKINVYPNPSQGGRVFVDYVFPTNTSYVFPTNKSDYVFPTTTGYVFPVNAKIDMQVTNSLGQMIFEKKALTTEGRETIELDGLPQGNYSIHFMESGRIVASRQFVHKN